MDLPPQSTTEEQWECYKCLKMNPRWTKICITCVEPRPECFEKPSNDSRQQFINSYVEAVLTGNGPSSEDGDDEGEPSEEEVSDESKPEEKAESGGDNEKGAENEMEPVVEPEPAAGPSLSRKRRLARKAKLNTKFNLEDDFQKYCSASDTEDEEEEKKEKKTKK